MANNNSPGKNSGNKKVTVVGEICLKTNCIGKGKIGSADGIKCTECSAIYHLPCAGFPDKNVNDRKNQQSNKNTWKCAVCAPDPKPAISQITHNKNESIESMFKTLCDKMNEVIISNQFLSDKYDKLLKTTVENSAQIKDLQTKVNALEAENQSLKKKLNDVETENLQIQARLRIDTVEIHGIPPTPTENVYEVIESVAKAAGINNISSSDISLAHRVPTKRDKNKTFIVAQFISRRKKIELLTAAREKKLKLGDIRQNVPVTEASKNIYVNEQWSQKQKELYSACKDRATLHNFQIVRARNGKVFVKKNKETSNFIIVEHMNELDKIGPVK